MRETVDALKTTQGTGNRTGTTKTFVIGATPDTVDAVLPPRTGRRRTVDLAARSASLWRRGARGGGCGGDGGFPC